MAEVKLAATPQKPAIICDHESCRAALPGPVKFCPYCGTETKAGVLVDVAIRPSTLLVTAPTPSSPRLVQGVGGAKANVANKEESAANEVPPASSENSNGAAPDVIELPASVKTAKATKRKGMVWPWVAGTLLAAWLLAQNYGAGEPTSQESEALVDAAAQSAAEALAQQQAANGAEAELEAQRVEAAKVEDARLAAEQAALLASRVEATVDPVSRASNPPRYPAEELQRRVEGTVTLLVNVDVLGVATNITVETSSGSQALDRAAFEAVTRWEFIPARQGGEYVEGLVRVPIVFAIPVSPPFERQEVEQTQGRARADPTEAAEPMLQRARVAMDNKNYDAAIALAESALQLDANNGEARRLMTEAEAGRRRALDSTTIR